MAITSVGYDGSINEEQWAIMAPRIGMPYWVADTDSLAATIVKDADRTVRLAGGQFGGLGVMDTSDCSEDGSFEPVSSGDRYDLIVARRDWPGAGGAPKLEPGRGGRTKKDAAVDRASRVVDDH